MPQAFVPLAPPNLEGTSHVKQQGTDLTDKQQAELDKVLAHFSGGDSQLPQVEKEKASLSDEEKCWLVSFVLGILKLIYTVALTFESLRLDSRMSACFGKS